MPLRLPAALLAILGLACGLATAPAAQDAAPLLQYDQPGVADEPGRVFTGVPMPRLRPERGPATLQAMIGQMIMVGFPGADPAAEWPSRAGRWIRDGLVGGVVLFSDNVVSPTQLRNLTSYLIRQANGPPPFIAVDQEGGTIQRLTQAKGFHGTPSASAVSGVALADAYAIYAGTAAELQGLNININFGPVVDLNVNPQNPAIGRLQRSYDRDPDTVVAYARQFIGAHRDAGVLTAAKHFPGHGSAVLDPHDRVVDITTTWQESELQPFTTLIGDAAVDMIMVGHLIHPRFSDGDRPASLSWFTLTDELRKRQGFRGLIVTDDLDMDAIRGRYPVEEAAVMAIAAGADLVIVANHRPPDPTVAERIVRAVTRAVEDGAITQDQITAAYTRILSAKQRLLDRRAVAPTPAAGPG